MVGSSRLEVNSNPVIGPDGAVAKSSANWLVGTRFAYRYWIQPRADF